MIFVCFLLQFSVFAVCWTQLSTVLTLCDCLVLIYCCVNLCVVLFSVCVLSVLLAMAASGSEDCPVCDKAVTNRHKNALQCARCSVWLHEQCAGIAVTVQNRPVLKHENLVYLCDPCLAATRLLWAKQSGESEMCEASTQTDKVGNVAKAVGGKVVEERMVQTKGYRRNSFEIFNRSTDKFL